MNIYSIKKQDARFSVDLILLAILLFFIMWMYGNYYHNIPVESTQGPSLTIPVEFFKYKCL